MRNETAAVPDNTRRLLLWIERALIGAGAVSLAWAAVFVADAVMFQRMVRAAMPAAPRAEVALTTSARPLGLTRGAPIGALEIPRLRLSTMVLHGSDARTLRRGPGHIEETAVPGQPGNVAIAGHRDTFFRPLRNVRVGDDIFIQTATARFHYRVSSLGIVDPTDVRVLESTATATLTLVTCYPFSLIGPAPERFIVRAEEVGR